MMLLKKEMEAVHDRTFLNETVGQDQRAYWEPPAVSPHYDP